MVIEILVLFLLKKENAVGFENPVEIIPTYHGDQKSYDKEDAAFTQ